MTAKTTEEKILEERVNEYTSLGVISLTRDFRFTSSEHPERFERMLGYELPRQSTKSTDY